MTLATKLRAGGAKYPTFVAWANAGSTATVASLTIDKPAGVQQGDLLVCVIRGNDSTWTGDTGWTEVIDDRALRVAWKIAGASEPASYTFNQTPNKNCYGGIFAFRGAAYDAVGTTATIGGNGSLSAPGVTLSSFGGDLLFVEGDNQASRTFTTPAGHTALAQTFFGTSSIQAFYKLDDPPGATGNVATTTAGGGGQNYAILVGFRGA